MTGPSVSSQADSRTAIGGPLPEVRPTWSASKQTKGVRRHEEGLPVLAELGPGVRPSDEWPSCVSSIYLMAALSEEDEVAHRHACQSGQSKVPDGNDSTQVEASFFSESNRPLQRCGHV